MSNKKPKLFFLVNLALSLLIFGLTAFGSFMLFTKFQEALKVDGLDKQSYSDYFHSKTIKKLRQVDDAKNTSHKPEGRISPFH